MVSEGSADFGEEQQINKRMSRSATSMEVDLGILLMNAVELGCIT